MQACKTLKASRSVCRKSLGRIIRANGSERKKHIRDDRDNLFLHVQMHDACLGVHLGTVCL